MLAVKSAMVSMTLFGRGLVIAAGILATASAQESSPQFRGGTDLVSQIFASWNQLDQWLRQLDWLRAAA